MSTSSRVPDGPPRGTAASHPDGALEQAFAANAGVLPELAAIAKLANEFFSAGPAASALAPSTASTATSPNVSPTPGLPVGVSHGLASPRVPSGPAAYEPRLPSVPSVPEAGGTLYFVEQAIQQAQASANAASAVAAPNESLRPGFAVPPGSGAEVARGSLFEVRPTLLPDPGLTRPLFDAASIRRDFPILDEVVHGKRLIWLDNAATTQKPQVVIDRIAHFYAHENSNIHRAAHALAARATDAYEQARDKVRIFLHAPSVKDIVFVRGATEGVNLVAQSWGRRHITEGDEIVLTVLEHHSNIVPWQQLAAEKGAKIRVAPVDNRGQVLLDEYEKLFSHRTRFVSFAHVSNALGTITPVVEMAAIAHRYGARVLVDGAQAVSHMPIDVQALDADFYVFSGHKMFAPTGIGVVYGKPEVFEASPPWQGGGNMITDVTFEKTTYQPPPGRFEAGTGSIADAVGLGAAIDYLLRIGMENVARYEHELLEYGTAALCEVPGLHLVGTAADKASVLSFVLDGFRTEDVGAALDRDGIAVRSGHHCAQPALRRFGLETSVRPSLALYNTRGDLDALAATLHRLTQSANRRTFGFDVSR